MDDYYQPGDNDSASSVRFDEVEDYVQRRSMELVILDFIRVLDQIKLTLAKADETFTQLFFSERQENPVPRYFQVVFLALYELIINRNLQIKDRNAFIAGVRRSADHINVQGGGGRWGADNRAKAVEAAVGMYQKYFSPSTEFDPAKIIWITQLQNLLSQSYTEQSAYDFKQGFFSLGETPAFDDANFDKILKTLVAISNIGRDRLGYVLVGIAESESTANRAEDLFGTDAISYEKFWITGVDMEIEKLGKTQDQFFQLIVDKIRNSSVSEPLKGYIASNLKPVRYYERTVYVFEAKGMPEPSMYNDEYYIRSGAQVEKLAPGDLSQLFKRYLM